MGKTIVGWIDITKAHAKLNPGKSLREFLPAAQKEWKLIKAGLHPTKMVKTASSDVKALVKLVKPGKKSRKAAKKSRSKKVSKKNNSKKKHSKKNKAKKGGGCPSTPCLGNSSCGM